MSEETSKDRKKALRLVVFSALGFLFFWTAGLIWFVGNIPDTVRDTSTRTDAIVVLTGGSERLAEGLELLDRDMADKLFVSGVYRGVDVEELLRISIETPEELLCCVSLGYDAEDTSGNALETAKWMSANGFDSLRVVTASYHLPRSLMEFRHAMPQAVLVPHPVFPPAVRLDNWWLWPGTAKLVVGEYMKYLASGFLYLMKGPRPEKAAPG